MKVFLGLLLVLSVSEVHCQLSEQTEIQYLNDRAHFNLARDRDSVCYYSRQAFELNRGQYPTEEAKTYVVLGMCQKYEGKLDSAYVLFDLARDFFRENEMIDDLGVAYWYLGKVWFDLQQFEKAAPLYIKAIAAFEATSNYESQFKVINGLAVMHFMQGKYTEGLDYLHQALAIVERQKLYHNHFKLYNNLGSVYSHLKEHDRALEFNELAMSITDTSSNKGLLVQALGNRAEIFRKLGRLDSAIHYYDQSVKIGEKFEYDTRQLLALKSDLHYSKGEIKDAITDLRVAVASAENNDRIEKYLLRLGNYYFELNSLDSALFFAQKALEGSLKNDVNIIAYRSAKLLSEIHLKQQNYRLAHDYLNQYSIYRDSVFNTDTESKLSDFRVQIETLDKTNEIELLKARAELDEVARISIIRQSVAVVLILILIIVMILLWNRNRQKKQKISYLKLQGEMEMNDLELQKQTLYMINVNNQMKEVEDSLRSMNLKNDITNGEIRKIISGIVVNRSMDKEWDKFENYFSKAHKKFKENLQAKHGNLTQQDRRLTTLIKMDLSTREIASILDIEQRSVIIKRYRLKKKLNLEKDGDLEAYIQTL